MVRPRREEQCLPKEDATSKRDAGTHGASWTAVVALGAARSRFPDPSGDALECHFVALLGIVVQATTFVARLAIIPILTATRSAEDLFRDSLGSTPHCTARFMHPSPMADGLSDRGGYRQFQQDIKIGKIVAK
jgi:hypothetical protein